MSNERQNQQFLLAARPAGEIKPADFELVDAAVPTPGDGEVLVAVKYLAVEPAMKGWMEARVDYIAPLEIGAVMRGQGAGIVIESNNADFPVGTPVTGHLGWRRYLVTDGKSMPLRKLPEGISLQRALNVLGVTGLTAYFGMLDIGRPQAGDTVLVSGAAGATGSVAGQLARIQGARVIGIAGGKEKCDWLVAELGFDGAIDYKSDNTAERVAELCPDGLNVYFDNVGGEILDIALANLADKARVVLCGGISRYNETGHLPGPVNYFNLVYRRARMEGFIVLDYASRFPEAIAELSGWLNSGELHSHETVLPGFERLPEALIGLFHGNNIGKQLVQVDDPIVDIIRYGATRKLLTVARGHPYERDAFHGLTQGLEEFDTCHVEQPAAQRLLNRSTAEDFDALLCYDMPGVDFTAAEPPGLIEPHADFIANYLAMLEAGIGMVFMHHALAAWPAWEDYAHIVGGRFHYRPATLAGEQWPDSGYRHQVRHRVTVLPGHPVTQGLPNEFEITDELYLCPVFEQEVVPLLKSDYAFEDGNFYSAAQAVQGTMNSREGWSHPRGSNLVGWAKHWGNSPIVYLQGGDDASAMQNEHFQRLVHNAVRWVSSDEAKTWARGRNA